MTPTLSLMLAAFVLPGFENVQLADGTPAVTREDARFGSLQEAREAVTRVLRASNRPNVGRDLRETATSVVSTYRQLARSEKVPLADRRRLQARLRARLSEQELALRREQQTGTSLSGGVAIDADVLIDLIQTTIAPETWAINGGLGTIYYFPNR